MRKHKSTAYLDCSKWHHYRDSKDIVTPQFRFIVRMAQACADRGVTYDVRWKRDGERMLATVAAVGNIPTPARLKKPADTFKRAWKPKPMDASYTLNAFRAANEVWKSGYQIQYYGLALVKPAESESGEIEIKDGDNLNNGWSIVHARSGITLGIRGTFSRMAEAVERAVGSGVDWTQAEAEMRADKAAVRVHWELKAKYGDSQTRDWAKEKLERMAA